MLKLDLLNLYIGSTIQVLSKLGLSLKKERLSTDDFPHTLHEINVTFGISGSVSSTLVMGMDDIMAKKLAALMLKKPVTQIEFVENAVSMIGCEICQAIADNMNQNGHDVFPRQSTLIRGREIALSTLKDRKLVVGLETQIGTMDLRITI